MNTEAFDKLTPKLQEALAFIQQYIKDRGYAPSVREIGGAAGIASTSTVHAYLKQLEEKGFLRRDPAKPRAMVILSNASQLSASDIVHEDARKPITGHSEKPFFNEMSTHLPYVEFEALENVLLENLQTFSADPKKDAFLPKSIFDESPCIITRMPDDSMANRQLSVGDFLIIRLQHSANTADVALCSIRGEIVIRTYYKGLRQARLQAENDAIEPIMADHGELTILGVVVGFLRLF